MTRAESLVALNMAADIGSGRLKKLLQFFDTPENILKASREQLVRVSGIAEKTASRISSFRRELLQEEISFAAKHDIRILTLEDKEYPENLKNIFDPPIVLYVKGTLAKEDVLSIAIVGSRRASLYGLSSAERFGRELSELGFAIVSGMARGIDTCAHRGAIKAGGRTIAVMGSGFKHIYPQENIGLSEKISENGAVISEFPLDAAPLKQNFPRRNRVISGLSAGVLVVEAARNSGALITVDFALEQGREVFALPGKVDSATSCGTNELIKQGAKLVSSADDIAEEFSVPAKIRIAVKEDPPAGRQVFLPTDDEARVLSFISRESIAVDELVEKTHLDIPRISDILLKLQCRKVITQLPGKHFVRSEHEK